jgi:hypothetical protein
MATKVMLTIQNASVRKTIFKNDIPSFIQLPGNREAKIITMEIMIKQSEDLITCFTNPFIL